MTERPPALLLHRPPVCGGGGHTVTMPSALTVADVEQGVLVFSTAPPWQMVEGTGSVERGSPRPSVHGGRYWTKEKGAGGNSAFHAPDERRGRCRHSRRRGWRCSQPAGVGATAGESVSQTGGWGGGESRGTPVGRRGAAHYHPWAPSSVRRPRLLAASLTVQEPLPSNLLAGKSSAASSDRLPRTGTERRPSRASLLLSLPSHPLPHRPPCNWPPARCPGGGPPRPRWLSSWRWRRSPPPPCPHVPRCCRRSCRGPPPPARPQRRSTFPPAPPPTRPQATRPPTSAVSTRH